jgi:hypothetical protein
MRLLGKGSALTFLVPDMVDSMVHAMDHCNHGSGFNVGTLYSIQQFYHNFISTYVKIIQQ